MTRTFKRITTWILGALAFVALSFGIVFTMPRTTVAKAQTSVTFNAAVLGDATHETYGTSIRFDTAGETWKTYHNWVNAKDWASIADYTTVNGRTVTEINNATTNEQKITLMMQPAGSFSFLRLYIPAEIMALSDVKSMGILDGWSFNNGADTFTSSAVTFLRNGDVMVPASNYSAAEKLTASDITIGDAQLVNTIDANRGADSYSVDINIGRSATQYDTMYDAYKTVRSAIYINGKSIEEWNAQLIAEDPKFGDPSTYSVFPQNSTDPSHPKWFAKPIGFWGTSTGYRVSIFQELVADLETVTVTVGAGCYHAGNYMVAETVSKTVLTQTVVDITEKLSFLNNTNNSPAAWGPTSMYYINTNGETYWTKPAPKGGCLNECDPAAIGGGQVQLKYIYFNGTSVYDINKNDHGTYNSTQSNIANGGIYAPIFVGMSSELGSSLKLIIPQEYTNGKAGHEEIIIKKGFNVKEGNTSYVVTSDIIFTNNNNNGWFSTWSKEVKAIEYETEVTGIITYANRTDGGNNENFVLFQLSNNDYAGLNTTAISDISSLYGYIDIDGNVLSAKPSEPFFNVWGIQNSIAFRAPGLDAAGLQQVEYITIKAGAKFPAYTTQNGGKTTYYVTTEDVTFIHNVPNDTWTIGSLPSEYTVTFMVEGNVYHTATVARGEKVSAPTTPTKAADAEYTYTFQQWELGGIAYDFNARVESELTLVAAFTATPRNNEVDITDELSFHHQVQQSAGTEPYLIRTQNNYWTKPAPKGGCLNEHDAQGAGGGQEQMKYMYLNGTSLYDINKNDNGSYGSSHGNIVNGGIYAPIFAIMGTDNGKYSYIQLHVPSGYPNVEASVNENHKTFEIKAGFSVTENGTTYVVTRDLKWVNLNGSWVKAENVIEADDVTIGNPRVDGVAKELYKVDIVSNSWSINCNYYDFMYGGQYAEFRKFIFINGVSVYDINENTDDSNYKYSTFPMTGADDAMFAKPVLIEAHIQGGVGDPRTLTLWIHKDYMDSLGDDVVITLGAGYNAFTGGKSLGEDVNYDMIAEVTIDDGTNTVTSKIVKGTLLKDLLGIPSKEMTDTAIYDFDNWYNKETETVVDLNAVVLEDMEVEARYSITEIELHDTEVYDMWYSVGGEGGTDRWLLFYLTEHDYPMDIVLEDLLGLYEFDVLNKQLFSYITLQGEFTVGSQTKTEATLAEIFNANGHGEAIFINIWRAEFNGTLAVRVPGAVNIKGAIISSGASFPSYAYAIGDADVDTRYMVKYDTALKNVNAEGLDGHFNKLAAGIELDFEMAPGAGVRLSGGESGSGIRFETKISKDSVDFLVEALNEGDYTDIQFGTLIVPKDYLMGGLFTHEWLNKNGFAYLDIKSTANANNFPKFENGYYSYFGSIVNLKKNNYGRDFAAVGYIALYMGGEVTYIYADYEATNTRSASYIANAAINDRSANETSDYNHYISANNNYSPYSEANNKFLEIYLVWDEDSAINMQDLTELQAKGGSQTITPATQKLNGPYIELVYSTNVNVRGVFTYTDGNKTANEDFYLQAGTTTHKQYLDIFRKNGVGYGMNTSNLSMTSITFTNAELANSDAPTGKVKVIGLYSINKSIDTQNLEIYLTVKQNDGSEMTVGAHLGLGGALTYLAKSGIYEGVTASGYRSGNVKLSTSTSGFVDKRNTDWLGTKTEAGYYGSATSSKPADGAVNLINNTDAGRQIQQSWYANINDNNGYTRAFCKTESASGKYWPYNPVQAGDVVSNPSQIVDYEINLTRGYIYIKARAMDWAKGQKSSDKLANTIVGGETTKSYIENYYRLNEDCTLTVNNGYVDWNGFTDMELADWASTELPAVYPIQTLNYYVSNLDGDGSWTDGLEYNNGLGSWTDASKSCRQLTSPNDEIKNTKVEDWFAWANGGDGNAFGMGMYIPNVNRFTSGRPKTTTALSESANRDATTNNILDQKGLMANMQPIKYTYQGAYVTNTSYTAPGIDFRMEAYKPIEYSYVICLGSINQIRSTFKGIKDNGTVTNAGNGYQRVGLDTWARADKKWTW